MGWKEFTVFKAISERSKKWALILFFLVRDVTFESIIHASNWNFSTDFEVIYWLCFFAQWGLWVLGCTLHSGREIITNGCKLQEIWNPIHRENYPILKLLSGFECTSSKNWHQFNCSPAPVCFMWLMIITYKWLLSLWFLC